MTSPILLAYSIDGKGSGKPLSHDEAAVFVKDKSLAWVHLDANNAGTKQWLHDELTYLDPLIVDALLAEETRPRVNVMDDGVLLILRGVNLNENADPEDMVSIRLWVDAHRIISVRKRKLKAVQDVEDKIKAGKGPHNAGDFICMLANQLLERMEPTLSELDDTTDDIEEKVLETANASLRESIISVRKKAILFRRYMAPQRDAIFHLRNSDVKIISPQNERQLQEIHNHITRYVEDLDAIRDRSQIIKDELANMMAEKLNKNMYVLSVIAAIFLPLSFLTGLLGVNLAGIPWQENAQAFTVFSAILAAIIAVQIVIFKKLKWF